MQPAPTGALDGLDPAVEVAPTRTSALTVLLGLLVVGAAIALFVIVTTSLITHAMANSTSACEPGGLCATLGLDQVERYSNIDFPQDARVIDSSRIESGPTAVFSATVELPLDASLDFALAGYGSTSTPGRDWSQQLADGGYTSVSYLAAESGDGSIVGDAVYGTTADDRAVVLVVVTETQ